MKDSTKILVTILCGIAIKLITDYKETVEEDEPEDESYGYADVAEAEHVEYSSGEKQKSHR